MKANKFITLIFSLGLYLTAAAQDVHYSQFSMSPMLLNPALAGMSQGDYRIYANFRTQWNTVSDGSVYRTFAGGGDVALGRPTRFNSYAGLGLSFFSDQAGSADFQSNRVDLTFAYHFVLSKRRLMTLSFGIQGAFNHIGFDPSRATYDFSYDQSTGNVNGNQKETFARSKVYFGDIGAGVFYNVNVKKGSDIYLGLGFSHINQPNISFFKGNNGSGYGEEKLHMKFTAHGGATVQLKDKFWMIPNFFVMVQGPAQQYNLGALFKMQMGNKVLSRTFFYLGAQVRLTNSMVYPMTDAVIIHTRLDYKALTIGLSYDVNISKLMPATSTFGAPEISLVFTGVSKHKPRPGYCPVML
jgi:type IX secretion system PorP/SprF family membrane protein